MADSDDLALLILNLDRQFRKVFGTIRGVALDVLDRTGLYRKRGADAALAWSDEFNVRLLIPYDVVGTQLVHDQ